LAWRTGLDGALALDGARSVDWLTGRARTRQPAMQTLEEKGSKLGVAPFKMPKGFKLKECPLWIVAVDFSQQSMCALRLAAKLCALKNNGCSRDNMLVVTLAPAAGFEKVDNTRNFQKCDDELRRCFPLTDHVVYKTIAVPEGWSISDVLVYYANHAYKISDTSTIQSRLVIGAAGAADEEQLQKKNTSVEFSALGRVAAECAAKCKVPVVLAKRPWATRSAMPGVARGGDERNGRNGLRGLTIAVCVTELNVSSTAFDLALSFCRPGDTLLALHVGAVGAVVNNYSGVCIKAVHTGLVSAAHLCTTTVLKTDMKNGGVAAAILRLALDSEHGPADVLVMGSVELKKAQNRHVIGSVTMALARDANAPHLCVVKSYS